VLLIARRQRGLEIIAQACNFFLKRGVALLLRRKCIFKPLSFRTQGLQLIGDLFRNNRLLFVRWRCIFRSCVLLKRRRAAIYS
jgi:hypothetical protein